MRIGSEFYGTSQIEVSNSNEEVIPKNTIFYKFSFLNEEDCTVKINGSDPIFLRAGIGFSTNQVDSEINSFVVVESGIEYFWIGGR